MDFELNAGWRSALDCRCALFNSEVCRHDLELGFEIKIEFGNECIFQNGFGLKR